MRAPALPARAMIQHVSIEVREQDVDRCVAFYELIGFHRVDPPRSLADRTAWLERDGGTQVHLMLAEDPVVPPSGHHAVLIGEEAYDETLAALRGAGFEPVPRKQHWGSPRAFVRNPAGHRVELMATSPARG